MTDVPAWATCGNETNDETGDVTGKPRILIVLSEKRTRSRIKKIVPRYGYKVSSVVSTGEAVVLGAATDKPDLILMDIQLRGELDGIKTAEILRQRHPRPGNISQRI